MPGPMDVIGYVADASHYCEDCAVECYGSVGPGTLDREGNELGALFGDAEIDYPAHCDACGQFLENRLTPDGYGMVADAVGTALAGHVGAVVDDWIAYYGGDAELRDAVADLPYVGTMLHEYLRTALWLATDEDGKPLEGSGYNGSDPLLWDDGSWTEARADCAAFVVECLADLAGMSPEQAGMDFYLTRCHHGAGFWDRGLGDRGERLTKAANAYGSSDVMENGDGPLSLT